MSSPEAPSIVADLLRGARRALHRGVEEERPAYAYTRVAALASVDVALVFALHTATEYRLGAEFIGVGAGALLAPILAFGMVLALVALVANVPAAALDLAGEIYGTLPILLLADFAACALRSAPRLRLAGAVVDAIVALSGLVAFVAVVRARAPRAGPTRVIASVAIVCVAFVLPWKSLHDASVWMRFDPRSFASEEDYVDPAAFFSEQADRARSAEAALRPERKGVTDLYFVGVAGYDAHVFGNEIAFARGVFDRRFATAGHSLLLSNESSTHDSLPMATPQTLRRFLATIGSQMDRDRDILFLYMTSHGSRDGLALDSARFPFELRRARIAPDELRADLEDAGIKWRVIVVAGCSSGVFVSALENDDTVVATAASSEGFSMGCSPTNEFTDYGRALFRDTLPHESSIVAALQKAGALVVERERKGDAGVSSPQLFVGEAIAQRLAALRPRPE